MGGARAQRVRPAEGAAGRRPAGDLSVDRVVAEALRLIDDVGLEGFTMARLGSRLGTSAMAPYRYVESKEHLLELAADSILAGVTMPPPSFGPWDARLRAHALEVLELQDRHPWFPMVLVNRYLRESTDTPNVARHRAELLKMLAEEGFPEPSVDLAAGFFAAIVTGLTVNGAFRARAHWASPSDGPPARARRAGARNRLTEHDHRCFVIDTALDGLRRRHPGFDDTTITRSGTARVRRTAQGRP